MVFFKDTYKFSQYLLTLTSFKTHMTFYSSATQKNIKKKAQFEYTIFHLKLHDSSHIIFVHACNQTWHVWLRDARKPMPFGVMHQWDSRAVVEGKISSKKQLNPHVVNPSFQSEFCLHRVTLYCIKRYINLTCVGEDFLFPINAINVNTLD